MTALPPREGYRLWAPNYEAETAISYLENAAVERLGVRASGCSLLDVGCGTGRRLRDCDAELAVGVDLTPEMLTFATGTKPIAAADIRALPFSNLTFDIIWCRLVIGHVREMEAAYAELSRVCCMGGKVIVTDLSAEAVAAGHRRTFLGADGVTHEVEHFAHTIERQAVAAFDFGLRLEKRQDGVVDPTIKHFYAEAGKLSAYEEQLGLPIVLAMLWRKDSY
jgi:malonyl-CoA O-methyltransferase